MEDDRSRVQNSGAILQAKVVHFVSCKDKNSIATSMSYFKIIQEILEVDDVSFRLPIFKCKLIDRNLGVMTDDLRFTLVDLTKISYMNQPFIMVSQARQIFYVTDPTN